MISDYDPKILSIILDWNENGSITHRFEDAPLLPYSEKNNLLVMSVPVLIAYQLGDLCINRAVALCHYLLTFIHSGEIAIEPINSVLSGWYIDIYQGKNIYYIFSPHKSDTASVDSVEDGVKQMLCNYVWHICSVVPKELKRKINENILKAVHKFLTEALPLVVSRIEFKSNQKFPEIQKQMLQYSLYLPIIWKTEETMTTERYTNIMNQAKQAYQSTHQKLHKSREFDCLSKLEQLEFVVNEILPAMREAARIEDSKQEIIRESKKMPSKITQDELNEIWLRWDQYEMPRGVENKSWRLLKKLNKKISEMVFLTGKFNKQTASMMGEQVGSIVSNSFLLCYYIGYELASGRMPRSDGTPYLAAATDPINEFVLGLLGTLVGNGALSKEEGKRRVLEIANLTGKASNDVCVLGINNFSKIKSI